MPSFDIISVALLGLVLGSFATALSWRLPREISITTERSQCPACRRKLGVADLVPLFSWILLRGKCRTCNASIGWRYPLIEISTLALCLVFYVFFGFKAETWLVFLLAPVLVSIIDIDLHHKIIPDSLNLSILLIGVGVLLVNALTDGGGVNFFLDKGGAAAAGAVVYGGGSWLLRQGAMVAMKKEALGLGDVKFYAAAGFWLGLNPDAAALFMIISGLCGIVLSLIWKKKKGEAEAPFGPSLIVGFITAICFCPPSFISL